MAYFLKKSAIKKIISFLFTFWYNVLRKRNALKFYPLQTSTSAYALNKGCVYRLGERSKISKTLKIVYIHEGMNNLKNN